MIRGWARATTHQAPLEAQIGVLEFAVAAGMANDSGSFMGRISVDPLVPTFDECREGNNDSALAMAFCAAG